MTLTIRDEQNPYRYTAEVCGQVVETVGDHIDELSQKYPDGDYPPDNNVSERMMLWIVPNRQTLLE